MIQLIALGSTGLKARIYIYRQVRLVTGDKAQEWRQQASSLSKKGGLALSRAAKAAGKNDTARCPSPYFDGWLTRIFHKSMFEY